MSDSAKPSDSATDVDDTIAGYLFPSPAPPRPPLIGLGGRKTAGKDTAADRLTALHGYAKVGMSDPLHWMLERLNPLLPSVSFPERDHMSYADHAYAVGYVEAKKHPEVRRLQKIMGTEVMRTLDEDFWVRQAEKAVFDSRERGFPLAITGIRFPNEIDMIRRHGGLLVWVERPGIADGDTHASETSVGPEDFDIVLRNDTTVDRLHDRVDILAEVLPTMLAFRGRR